jgi:hypothetical protein
MPMTKKATISQIIPTFKNDGVKYDATSASTTVTTPVEMAADGVEVFSNIITS